MKKVTSRARSEMQFLLVSGVLVIILGIPSVTSLLKESENNVVNIEAVSSRTPASMEGSTEQAISKSTALLKIDCERSEIKESVSSNFVRLTGMPCKDSEDVEIKNKTNGFSASVIFLKGNKFTTDFIDLSEGENNLEITSTNSEGQKITKVLKINRRTPASENKLE